MPRAAWAWLAKASKPSGSVSEQDGVAVDPEHLDVSELVFQSYSSAQVPPGKRRRPMPDDWRSALMGETLAPV